MRLKNSQKSIFSRIILMFIIVVIPLYILGIFLFEKSREMMVQQYVGAIQNQISIYFKNLEDDLDRISKVQDVLVADGDSIFLSNKDISEIDFDSAQAVNRVIRQLKNAKISNEYIKEITLNYVRMNRELSSAYVSYHDFDIHKFMHVISSNSKNSLKYYDGDLFLVTFPLGINADIKNVQYYIESQLNKEKIVSNINNFNVVEDALSCMYFKNFDLLLYSNPTLKDIFKQLDSDQIICQQKINGEDYLIVSYSSDYLQAKYIQFIPEKVAFKQINDFRKWYILFSLFLITIVYAYTLYMYVIVKKPIDILVKAFKKVQEGDFNVYIEPKYYNEFGIMDEAFNNMVQKIKTLIEDVYVHKILTQKAELRQLQAQINPHFLYNSFFLLKKRINNGDYEDAKIFTEMLGTYFKYITKNYKDYTTLGEEVKQAKIYARIQGIRFKERIHIIFDDLPENCADLVVPRLILQPILENSFKYGLEEVEIDGILKVSFVDCEKYISIFVEDNAQSFLNNEDTIVKLQNLLKNSDSIQEITGLFNIHKRLQLLSGDKDSGLTFSKSDFGGLKVMVKISKESSYD